MEQLPSLSRRTALLGIAGAAANLIPGVAETAMAAGDALAGQMAPPTPGEATIAQAQEHLEQAHLAVEATRMVGTAVAVMEKPEPSRRASIPLMVGIVAAGRRALKLGTNQELPGSTNTAVRAAGITNAAAKAAKFVVEY